MQFAQGLLQACWAICPTLDWRRVVHDLQEYVAPRFCSARRAGSGLDVLNQDEDKRPWTRGK